MRYLVTGATGFIGSRLVPRLVARGHAVTVLVRDAHRYVPQAGVISVVEGDLATGSGLEQAVRDADRVIHLAGVVAAARRGGYAAVNAEGTRRLCAAAAAAPRPPRLVYCSSLAATGPSAPGRPRAETDPPAPVSAYGASKLAGEQALRVFADRVPGVVLRPPIVYGPGDRAFLPTLVAMVRSGLLPVCGRGPRHYSLIHVDDLCTALLASAEKGPTLAARSPACQGVYHLGDGAEHDLRDIAAVVAGTLGRRQPRPVRVPAAVATGAAWVSEAVAAAGGRTSFFNRDKVREARHASWTCTTERAARHLGFTATVPIREGLRLALTTPHDQPLHDVRREPTV
ncbi:NAD-dependent epimerase/dehydratase family protein [Streptomyces abikoensis]|uniref:NAD-dependent epimerase/dehydratase family protein n=1 Tax=Streptomyces abikoensis TaxID=97398 RepID=A0ABW7TEY8_9ACTN